MEKDAHHFHRRGSVALLTSCPLCHTRYRPFEATVIDAHENAYLIYVHCGSCSAALLAHISLDQEGARSVGVVTDLTKEEAMQYRRAGEITADDVIEAHQLLH